MNKIGFNPHDYLVAVTVKNTEGEDVFAPYLPVKVSEVWFRNEYPKGRISTEMMGLSGDSATFKASIYLDLADPLPVVEGTATRYIEDGKYFVTAAETAAVGKALSRLGFGTPLDAQLNDEIARRGDTGLEEGIPVDNLTNILPTYPKVMKKDQDTESVPEKAKEEKPKKTRKSRNADSLLNDDAPIETPEPQSDGTDGIPRTFDEARNVTITFKSAAWTGKQMGDILNSKTQSPEFILEYILKSVKKEKFPKEYAAAEILLDNLKAA